MKKPADVLKAVLKRRQWKHLDLALALGVDRANLSQTLRRGSDVGASRWLAWCDVLQIDPGTGEDLKPHRVNERAGAYCSLASTVPCIAHAAAGEALAFTDQGYPAGGGMYDVARPPDLDDPRAFAVEVAGDSMNPKYEDGQVVLVDTRKDPLPGGPALVRLVSGEVYLKFFRRARGKVTLESVNPAYPPVTVPASSVQFAYRIVWAREK